MPQQTKTSLQIHTSQNENPQSTSTRMLRSGGPVMSKRKANDDFRQPSKRSALGDVTNRTSTTSRFPNQSTNKSTIAKPNRTTFGGKPPTKKSNSQAVQSSSSKAPIRKSTRRPAGKITSVSSNDESSSSSNRRPAGTITSVSSNDESSSSSRSVASRCTAQSETSDSSLSVNTSTAQQACVVLKPSDVLNKKESVKLSSSSASAATSSSQSNNNQRLSVGESGNKTVDIIDDNSAATLSILASETENNVMESKADTMDERPDRDEAETENLGNSKQSAADVAVVNPPKFDFDAQNRRDIFQAPEYAQDIFEYFFLLEEKYVLPEGWLKTHPNITERMRTTLVDWLIEVQEQFQLNHETLYLAAKLTDLYIYRHPELRKEQYQLVGATAMFLAGKFDERIAVPLDDFIYICGNESEELAYTRQEFVAMEKDIFVTADCNLGIPISYRFLRRFAKTCLRNMQTLTLARYFNETVLLYSKFSRHKESLVAAACLRLAMVRLEPTEQWDRRYEHYTTYSTADLKELCLEITDALQVNANTMFLNAAEKYSHEVFHSVSELPPLNRSYVLEILGSS